MLLSPRQPSYFLSPNPSSTPSPPPRGQPDLSLVTDRVSPSNQDSYTYSPTSSSFSTSSSGSFPAPHSPNSKTAAFFSTPVSSPNPPSHAKLPDVNLPSSRSRTDDFFSSPSSWLSTRPTPPASVRSVSPNASTSSRSDSTSSSPETPDDLHLTIIPPPEDAVAPNMKTASFFSPPAPRSLTADFFSTGFSARPTPPPSLRSVSSNTSLSSQTSHVEEATPKPKPVVPSMARLFPSRYSSIRDDDDALMPSQVSHRGFVDIEEDGLVVASPTSTGLPERSHREIPHDVPPISHNVYITGSMVHVPDSQASYELVKVIGQGAFSHVWNARAVDGGSHVVAVKILSHLEGQGERRRKEARAERTAFRREVDLLEHLSTAAHRSLPAFYGAVSLPTADVVVLEYVSGGELLELVNSDEAHAELTEGLLKRMWGELVDVVAWMHSQCVVHRDVKLENILLTTAIPASPPPPAGAPLIKLTDFGLARAIDPSDPWLRTRCGSESYAAPELLLTSHVSEDYDEDEGACTSTHLSRAPTDGSRHVPPSARRANRGEPREVVPRREGAYDGRETDAWALGVALYALVTRMLPFDPPPELEDRVPARTLPMRERERRERERKAWAMRVVRGEVVWPEEEEGEEPSSPADDGHGSDDGEGEQEVQEVKGTALAGLEAVRRVVGRLLVRDPKRRAKVAELVGVW